MTTLWQGSMVSGVRMMPSLRLPLARLARLPGELLFPARCVSCATEGSFFCPRCVTLAPRLPEPYCWLCARPVETRGLCALCVRRPGPLDGILAPFRMEGAVQEAVHAVKYRNVRALAPVLGAFVADHIRSEGVAAEAVVVPVPLHGGRLRERGYNQAELLARVIAKELDLDLCPDGLRRVRATAPQVSARRDDRRRNVSGAFQVTRRFEGQRVVLMDDVSTTGATLTACAEALREAGALQVWGVAVAREL